MSETASKGWAIPWPTIIALLVAGGGAYVLYPPLVSERPSVPPGPSFITIGALDVDARAWQDPFRAVLDHQSHLGSKQPEMVVSARGIPLLTLNPARQPSESRENEAHALLNLTDGISAVANEIIPMYSRETAQPTLLVLPVMVSSSRQAEPAEQRLRTRQAVLEGLAVAGFASLDPEHIGYANVPWNFRKADSARPSLDDMKGGGPWAGQLPVPYEWCVPTFAPVAYTSPTVAMLNGALPVATSHRPGYVLVVWIAEEAFSDHPLARLAYLMDQLKLPADRIRVGLIGPRHWDTLWKMAYDASPNASARKPLDFRIRRALADTTMYVATATPEDEFLLRGQDIPSLEKLWQDRLKPDKPELPLEPDPSKRQSPPGMRIVRAVMTDAEVTKSLVEELKRRQIKGSDHIGLILECDSMYGRGANFAMAASIAEKGVGELLKKNNGTGIPQNIHLFTYLRGVDGRLPSAADERGGGNDSTSGTDKDSGDAQSKSGDRAGANKKSPEPSPDGYNQTDYLQRIGEQLRETDRELKMNGQHGLKAIGVLGSDLYDKLLILKALRRQLPSAVFFTTTADDRYALPAEWPSAHNLVIGSSFGLMLRPEYQKGIPPFRDSQQTATFAATLVAAGVICDDPNQLKTLLGTPRIFEVGRGRLFDLSLTGQNAPVSECRNSAGAMMVPLHPDREDLKGWWTLGRLGWATFFIIPAFFLLRLLQRSSLQYEDDPKDPRDNSFLSPARVLFASFVPIAILIVWFLVWLQRGGGAGEPFSLFGGVSVWPSETLRLLAFIWSLYFLLRADSRTDQNDAFIQEKFGLVANPTPISKRVRRGGLIGPWDVEVFVPARNPVHIAPAAGSASEAETMIDAQKLWDAYLMDSTWSSRFFRAGKATLAYYAMVIAIMAALGFSTPPCRGNFCWWVDFIFTYVLAVPFSILLTFFVIDSTFTNRRFIRYITLRPTNWRQAAYKQCVGRGLDDEDDLRALLDVRLIAQRTMVVGEFIYYPFLILFLLLLSRNSYFDDWDWPPGVVIVYLSSTLVAIVSVLMLRHSAEKARREAADSLRERAIYYTASGASGKADAVKQCITEIESERRGAFSLLSQHPLLAAILLPSGGIGIWALLEYLSTNVF